MGDDEFNALAKQFGVPITAEKQLERMKVTLNEPTQDAMGMATPVIRDRTMRMMWLT